MGARRWLAWLGCLVGVAGGIGCFDQPNRTPVAVARVDGGGPDAPADAAGVATDPGCPPGFHKCGGECKDSRNPMHCGFACEPCAGIAGGAPTCDGSKCGVSCPLGAKVCPPQGACIATELPCEGGCPAGTHLCNGACVDGRSLTACGSSCAVCPQSPDGTASCEGDTCALACAEGHHRCGDQCVKNGDVATCGSSCTPCAAPAGGEATCDGTSCGSRCPAGMQPCGGKCVPTGALPGSCACPMGQNECGGSCVAATDVNFCGPMCRPCVPPMNADATCNGSDCGFACRAGFCRSGAECKDSKSVDSCGPGCEVCPRRENATPTCNGTQCGLRCNAGFRDCGGVCKPIDTPESCGSECATCTAPPNGAAVCANGRCEFTCTVGRICESSRTCVAEGAPCGMSCPPEQRLCQGRCVPAASLVPERCDNQDNDCDGEVDEGLVEPCPHRCAPTMRTCRAGQWSACPPDVNCCNDNDCGPCHECNAGACRPQAAGQDKKNNCTAGSCRSDSCDGQGRCGVRSGATCSNGRLVTCAADGSESAPDDCGGRGCNPASNACCPTGTRWNGSQCATTCGPGTHDCDGVCRSNDSVETCGTRCAPCVPAANASATCAGGACGSRCDPGYDVCGSGPPCQAIAWSFESGLEGFTAQGAPITTSTAQRRTGLRALAYGTAGPAHLNVESPWICAGTARSIGTRTATASVYVEETSPAMMPDLLYCELLGATAPAANYPAPPAGGDDVWRNSTPIDRREGAGLFMRGRWHTLGGTWPSAESGFHKVLVTCYAPREWTGTFYIDEVTLR